ncbi:sucrose-6-phosphate hydrolase [Lactococcus chungangensis]|jgi:sucrose-6-phosphate hydrolase|uniref:sucrose-6-phosphate hydrolase n=1 Tax=Pseudolactococcus chungangensis TaxID=451457 RepID=UPI0028D51B7F|nr:sucrose-6-phosphate hydrolase [Lactococcus chungangensis]
MMTKIDYTKPWTSAERYRPYADYSTDYITALTTAVDKSAYRNSYHIQPKIGLLNDPNGFSFFNGKYHLFYQVFPYGPVHGLKSWALMTSPDLIHWTDEGLKLFPDTIFDSHGAYSGSALPLSDKELFLFYTGNTRGENNSRDAYQNGAIYTQTGNIRKFDTPLLRTPEGYTDHFRDPMIFDAHGHKFAIIGAQTSEEKGTVVLAQATNDSLTAWDYKGQLQFTQEEMGYMIECPNLVFIDKKPVLLFCPQGLDKSIADYDNIFPNMYVIADEFDSESATLTQAGKLHNLDDGFEVYATQAFNAPDGRVLASSWLGLPDLDVPSQADGWQGILSLVKELTLKNGQLYQYPVVETISLRHEKQNITLSEVATTIDSNSYELEIELSEDEENELYLFASADNSSHVSLKIDVKNGKIELNRANLPVSWAENYGVTRSTYVAPGKMKLNIFADTSSLEIFVNDGEKVMSSRIFTVPENTYLFAKSSLPATIWQLKK